MAHPTANSYYKMNGTALTKKSAVKDKYTKDEQKKYKCTAGGSTTYIAGSKTDDIKFISGKTVTIPFKTSTNAPVWAPPGYLPTFSNELWSADATSEDQTFELSRSDSQLMLKKGGSQFGTVYTAGNFTDDNVVPSIVVVVLQASGGGGAPGHHDGWYTHKNGGGGGGGACWVGMLNLSAASTWTIKLGKYGGTQEAGDGKTGLDGTASTIVGGSSGTITIGAGGKGTQSGGGSGGSISGSSYSSNYYYPLSVISGAAGGSPENSAGRGYPDSCIGGAASSGTASIPGSTSSKSIPGGSGGTPRNRVGDSGGWGGGGGASPNGNGGSAGWLNSAHETDDNTKGNPGSKGSGGGGAVGSYSASKAGGTGGPGFLKIYY